MDPPTHLFNILPSLQLSDSSDFRLKKLEHGSDTEREEESAICYETMALPQDTSSLI